MQSSAAHNPGITPIAKQPSHSELSGIVHVPERGEQMATMQPAPTFNQDDPEEMGKHIVAYLHKLFVRAHQNPREFRQTYYDREEIRAAMGIDDEDKFIEGLVWAERQGWITAQHDRNFVQ
jgi:hypothetical protein